MRVVSIHVLGTTASGFRKNWTWSFRQFPVFGSFTDFITQTCRQASWTQGKHAWVLTALHFPSPERNGLFSKASERKQHGPRLATLTKPWHSKSVMVRGQKVPSANSCYWDSSREIAVLSLGKLGRYTQSQGQL